MRLASEPNNKNLAFIFLAYEVLRVAAIERSSRTGEDREAAVRNLGDPPWETFNRFCKEADLKFEVLPPVIERRSILGRPVPGYSLMIRDIERDTVVSESEASAGERIMFSVVAWRFLAEASGIHYKVILLDEPDAHLHPSLVKQFLRVLEVVMVERHGSRVILTTHSPSTVALARDGQIFELKRHGEPRIRPVGDVSSVIAKLTNGLVAVDKATRFVVLEGITDLPFYERLWQLLVESGLPIFPGVAFFMRDGCSKVRETVQYLREWDFRRFYGVLDRDAPPNENKPEQGLYILARNGVENYLFDPLNVWLCLWMHKAALHKAQLYEIPDLRQGNGHLVKTMSVDLLQRAADSVVARVRPQLQSLADNADEHVEVRYVGGLQLRYPRWVIEYDDHDLAAAVRKTFEPYPFPDRDILMSFMTLNLISQDFWDIFKEIVA
ncbi:ATP-binding protein [Burkholderia cepacia]|nr:ATP-binding protein [Burkholderia cepacia]MBA9898524.1 ATP-binding protein [Burkholderia cepacia]MBA9945228.1 ATP-binding protein [Burkholderia cepacia]MBA9975756.1 ATP-binding protein [Burkholderia cepacia]MBA9993875.1 ATP-binding protein [Burkholderia cepacia]MBB0002503.1 ATP-binding protein [Burkholderia cepacia]